MRTLMLDSNYQLCAIVDWKRAISLHWLGKVEILEQYDMVVNSPRMSVYIPAVVKLKNHVVNYRPRIRMSKRNIYVRDGGKCQYCGESVDYKSSTLDHVIPRLAGGLSKWTNLVVACQKCNEHKGARTPGQAGMRQVHPETPSYIVLLRNSVRLMGQPPEVWKNYLPR